MAGLIDSNTGLKFGTGLQFQTQLGTAGLDINVFSPANIAGLQLWLAASDASTIVFGTGSAVATWKDKSGNSNDATQATAANRPTYVSNAVASYPGIQTGGSGTVQLVTPSFLDSTYNTSFSVYAVVAHSDSSSEVYAANNNQAWFGGADFAASTVIQKTSNLSVGESDIAHEPSANTQFLSRIIYNGSSRKSALYVPGANFSDDNNSVTGNLGLSGALTIGNFDLGGFAWVGYVFEIIIYKAALSSAQDSQVIAYLKGKFGL